VSSPLTTTVSTPRSVTRTLPWPPLTTAKGTLARGGSPTQNGPGSGQPWSVTRLLGATAVTVVWTRRSRLAPVPMRG
jgi:hypothetical protein